MKLYLTRAAAAVCATLIAAGAAAGPCIPPDLFPQPEPDVLRGGQEYRVLIAGDSWALFMDAANSLTEAFAENGFAQYSEFATNTTVAGSTAQEWNVPAMLQRLTTALEANPTIDVVHLHLGGNDFLSGQPGNGWYVGIDPKVAQARYDAILDDIEAVIDHCLAQRPDIQVVFPSYDYVNFIGYNATFFNYCPGTFADLGSPTPAQVNAASLHFQSLIEARFSTNDRVTLLNNFGWFQYWYGFPDMGIDPMTLTPPGDPSLPSPRASMFLSGDCFHASGDAYDLLGERAFEEFYRDHFEGASLGLEGFILY